MSSHQATKDGDGTAPLLPGAHASLAKSPKMTVQQPPEQNTPLLFNQRRQQSWSVHGEYDATSRADEASSVSPPKSPSTTFLQRQFDTGASFLTTSIASADNSSTSRSGRALFFVYCVVYALINVIISVPGLYGYAHVIFSHEVFASHMNALSKLVIFSSLMHQLAFTLFSSLPFAIGTVQDAGLIFLSSMSNKIATRILDSDKGTEQQVLSTVLVLLSLGTAALGLVLIFMGRCSLADAVSYLPMPVVGGYLAFIGYFCLEAGVGLSISENMTTIMDWAYLSNPESLILAAPALLSGLLLTWLSRKASNDAALPLAMVAIPAAFYLAIAISGVGLEGAREAGWVGDVAPPVPVKDLFGLVNFSLVRWDLILEILPTWVGMVFVVSFASCLDVAAISMDMGEALDTNKELATVGIGNLMSGLSLGYTGSYIFSQTIFTYRTGVHSRLIGVLIMLVFAYVVASPVNILQIAPLFFLGSTLIFIGYDLLYEWLIEVRTKIFLSEYVILWATFIAIQAVGMDAGIVIGVLVAIVDHVVHSAKTLNVFRVNKKSRAVRTPEEQRLLQDCYHLESPKIVTLEVVGSVFFGSSLSLLQRMMDELGLDLTPPDSSQTPQVFKSPHAASFLLGKDRRPAVPILRKEVPKIPLVKMPPKYLVLDLSRLHNLDASGSRSCFLQLVKICAKQRITVCACGASVRVDWMLRSNDVAYGLQEESEIKERYLEGSSHVQSERLLLFLTLHESLVFCETSLLRRILRHNTVLRDKLSLEREKGTEASVSKVFGRILGSSKEEEKTLAILEKKRYHTEIEMHAGQEIFSRNTHSDAFYVVLYGAVAAAIETDDPRYEMKRRRQIVSGAGLVSQLGSSSKLMDSSLWNDSSSSELIVASVWPCGGIFGYVDCLLERPRHFTTVATQEGTIVAKVTVGQLELMQSEEPALDGLIQRVLLQASLLDLANCSCAE